MMSHTLHIFTDDSKTTNQIKRRLIKLGLLQKSNLKGRTPEAIWSESAEEKLENIFKNYFKKVKNIVATIQDKGVEYSRRAIIDKLIKLGLIQSADDVRMTKKKDLVPMTETEMEPDGNRKTGRKNVDYANVPVEDVADILARIKSTPTVRTTLQWMLEEVQDELKDRQDSPGNRLD